MTENPWKRLGSRLIHQNPWFSVRQDDVIRPDQAQGTYSVVTSERAAVAIVPLWEDRTLTLVGQYRYPIDVYSWELPEGGGPLEGDPLDIAKRELREETGIQAASWQPLGRCYLSNCFLDERCHFFLAQNLRPGEAQPDGNEALVTRHVSLDETMQMAADGRITDAITIVGLFRLKLFLEKQKK